MTPPDSVAELADDVVVDVSAEPAPHEAPRAGLADASALLDPVQPEAPRTDPAEFAGDDPTTWVPQSDLAARTGVGIVPRQRDAASEELAAVDLPPVSEELKAIVEALIFASPEPLTSKALCKVLASEPKEDVQRALEALKLDYEQPGGLQLIEIAGGMQIVTRTELNEWVRRLFHERKSTKLSVQALETLAVIAYRQPVTSVEIAEIRGVNTSGVLATLMERKLVKIAGRKQVVGRPFLYATTREFLIRFGLNDLGDLPKVEDMADLLGFDLATALAEPMPADQMLPLGAPGEEAVETASSSDQIPPDEMMLAVDSGAAGETSSSSDEETRDDAPPDETMPVVDREEAVETASPADEMPPAAAPAETVEAGAPPAADEETVH